MQIRKWFPLVPIFLAAAILAGCGAPAATQMAMAPAPAATQAPAMEAYGGAIEQPAAPAPTEAALHTTGADTIANSAGYRDQMVIKNGDIRLLVSDTDRALDGVTQTITDVRGYVISSRVWYQDYYDTNYKYATITMGVPVDQFENALRRLRGLAVRVLEDTASGDDVTDQFVDLQSQLTNLEATRDRIKSFLDQAKTVDEALRINQQLSDVEVQIEKIKGQMNYLSNRSAFSTITINLEPDLPKIEATPTPTATPVPPRQLAPWNPGTTATDATNTLVSAYRLIVEFLIWLFIVILPIFGPPILLIWLVVWLLRRRQRAASK
jgi:hypothetical protein